MNIKVISCSEEEQDSINILQPYIERADGKIIKNYKFEQYYGRVEDRLTTEMGEAIEDRINEDIYNTTGKYETA